ncbi:MAG TPA: hypothetical protein VK698_38085 [Kofleriaceae bacterium]|nr:hypothetical protein [Kofleriaceae bacterium]
MKRTYSLAAKLVAGLTAVAFTGMGCTAGQDPGGADPGARQVTVQVWTNLPDESGTRQMQDFGSSGFLLDDFASWERALVVDGVETTDLATIRRGNQIVVPLDTGETATLVRRGDRLELDSFTGADDGASELPRGAVHAVRLLPAGFEVFLTGSTSDAPDTVVKLSGIEDLDAEQSALVAALALEAMLVSLEDGEQIAPAIAIAIIAAIVGAAWLALCGGLAWECAYRCSGWPGFQTQCAGVTVSVNPTNVQVGGGYSCRCQ